MSASEQRTVDQINKDFGADPVRRGALAGLAAVVLVALAGSVLALATGNGDNVLSVLLGAVVAAVMPLGTLAVLMAARGRSAQLLAGAVLATYLVKLVLVAVLLVGFASLSAVDSQVMGWAALLGVVLCLAAEVTGILRTRQLYVEP